MRQTAVDQRRRLVTIALHFRQFRAAPTDTRSSRHSYRQGSRHPDRRPIIPISSLNQCSSPNWCSTVSKLTARLRDSFLVSPTSRSFTRRSQNATISSHQRYSTDSISLLHSFNNLHFNHLSSRASFTSCGMYVTYDSIIDPLSMIIRSDIEYVEKALLNAFPSYIPIIQNG